MLVQLLLILVQKSPTTLGQNHIERVVAAAVCFAEIFHFVSHIGQESQDLYFLKIFFIFCPLSH